MKTPPIIRPVVAADRAAWSILWAGYLAFYKVTLTQEIFDATFDRILSGTFMGLIAEDAEGRALGIVIAHLHPGTWVVKPICYLEDLYVSETARGLGVGRALIAALIARGRNEDWNKIYWQTARDNLLAQKLYDKLAQKTDWLRYDLDL